MSGNLIRHIWIACGRLLFWATRPAIWVVLAFQPPRTRIVVVRGGTILLVKDWLGSGRWKLPGGGLHRGEDVTRGAVRELREEVALIVKPASLQSLGTMTVRSSGARIRIIAFWLEVDNQTKAMPSGFEISAAQWLPLSEIDSIQVTESTEAVLAAFQEHTGLLK